jgi:hypothetical protein
MEKNRSRPGFTLCEELSQDSVKEVIFVGCNVGQGSAGAQFLKDISFQADCIAVGFRETVYSSPSRGIFVVGGPRTAGVEWNDGTRGTVGFQLSDP